MKRNAQRPETAKPMATNAILESISDGVFTVDGEWRVTSFNRAAEKITGVSRKEALSLLMAHDWPGNVRELENVIERAFILCGTGRIDLAHLPDTLTGSGVPRTGSGGAGLREARQALDAQAIRAALEHNSGNRLAAAKELGVHKTTLFRKIRTLGIDLPGHDGRRHAAQ